MSMGDTTSGTEREFAYAWQIYRTIIPNHKKQFLGWIAPLDLAFFKNKKFLDAGCGVGRNSRWPLEAGAASAYVFDYDERTVAIARKNLEQFPNCTVAYKSIYDLAFEQEFDIAFCIGVVQHLADPRKAVEKLVRAVRNGGTLILWVYAQEGNEAYLRWFDPFRKYVTSRIHPRLTKLIAKFFTALLKVYLLFPQHKPYFQLLKERSFEHIEAMVFDQMLPRIAHYWRKDEVEALIKGFPVKPQHLVHKHGISWTLVAERI